jgi:hypothetical protein
MLQCYVCARSVTAFLAPPWSQRPGQGPRSPHPKAGPVCVCVHLYWQWHWHLSRNVSSHSNYKKNLCNSYLSRITDTGQDVASCFWINCSSRFDNLSTSIFRVKQYMCSLFGLSDRWRWSYYCAMPRFSVLNSRAFRRKTLLEASRTGSGPTYRNWFTLLPFPLPPVADPDRPKLSSCSLQNSF